MPANDGKVVVYRGPLAADPIPAAAHPQGCLDDVARRFQAAKERLGALDLLVLREIPLLRVLADPKSGLCRKFTKVVLPKALLPAPKSPFGLIPEAHFFEPQCAAALLDLVERNEKAGQGDAPCAVRVGYQLLVAGPGEGTTAVMQRVQFFREPYQILGAYAEGQLPNLPPLPAVRDAFKT